MDFVFTGWHPHCFCYVTPILASEEEMMKENEAWARGEEYKARGEAVRDVPDAFKEWVREKGDALRKGSAPYFVRDNMGVVEGILRGAKGGTEKGTSRSATKEAENIIDEDYLGRADYTKEQTSNMEFVAQTLGVERGKPMTFWNADGGESNRNAANTLYDYNCTSCVVANELRRRGFEVTAGMQLEILANDTCLAWKRKDGKQVEFVSDKGLMSKDINVLRKTLERLTNIEGSRWSLGWSGRGIALGHNICIERINGKMVLYDPQVTDRNAFWNLEEVVEKMDKEKGLELLRIDTLLLNEKILGDCIICD